MIPIPVDLRSDTVTRPDAAMRRAMAEAEVGDDVFEEDPTVRRLEETAAGLLGFERSLFMPTGTMGNQVAMHLLGRPGREVVCESRSHVIQYEMAAMAALSGMIPRPILAEDGLPTAEQVEAAIAPDVSYRTPTAMIVLENSHNMAGGRVMRPERTREILAVARRRGLPVHLDGARIFNAAAALGIPARELAAGFDSVMFSLSKGLGAPAGSILCGSESFVKEARRVRKMLGGGMRQVGVLAAAGLVALESGLANLPKDNATAAALGAALGRLPGVRIEVPPETNIVIFRVLADWFAGARIDGNPSSACIARLRERGILAVPVNGERVRMVTHRDLPADAVDRAVAAVAAGWAG